MAKIALEAVLGEMEAEFGRPLEDAERISAENAVNGYNAGPEGLREIKDSMRNATGAVCDLRDNQLLTLLLTVEGICDRQLLASISQHN